MTQTYQQVRASALDLGHPPALTRLDQVHPFDFVRSQSCHTTLSTIHWVKGALAKLADECAIPPSKLVVIGVLASLATLPNQRGYQQGIEEQLDAFWEVIFLRNAYLGLGRQSHDTVTP